jgi:beta-glucuronidase
MKNKWWFIVAVMMLALVGATSKQVYGKEAEESSVMAFFNGEPKGLVYPEPYDLIVNAQARNYRSLNGDWGYFVDENSMGWNVITKKQYYPEGLRYPAMGKSLYERGFNEDRTLKVPGDWNSQVAELDRYRGKVIYHKEVSFSPSAEKRYFFHSDGANYTTDLFVNGKLVGRHVGGYTAFNFEITDFLVDGQNIIDLRVDAHLDETTVPTMRTSDFWKFGGLTRDIGIIETPKSFISQYHIYLSDLKRKQISGWIKIDGAANNAAKAEVRIPQLKLSVPLKVDDKGYAEFSINANDIKLWSPNSPTLYDVEIHHNEEAIKDQIGFRTIETDGLKIKLNGEPIYLHGISLHEETVLRKGLANSKADAEASFKLVKELNANYVRLAHYPHNEHTLKLADKLGLLVWSEVPIVSLMDWENQQTLTQARNLVAENITRDLNRASIFTWSVSNESFPQTQARLDFLKELIQTARDLDKSNRLITSALIGNLREEFVDLGKALIGQLMQAEDVPADFKQKMAFFAKQSSNDNKVSESKQEQPYIYINNTDELGELVDIVGYNEYFGWYYSGHMAQTFGLEDKYVRRAMLSIMPRIRFKNAFNKPMIISEFGAGAKYGLRSDESLIWSEEFQADVYRAQLEMLEKSEYVQGISPWVLKDFQSHLRELVGIQDGYNRKGLVSEKGEKKLAFSVLADYYRSRSTK